jgi:hypothetical protein
MGTGSVFDDITVTGSTTGGVSMSGTTGTTTFGDGTGNDLSLTTTSGSAAAFGLSNAGAVSVPSGGTTNVSATGGPAIDVTGTSGASLAFDDVDSTNSANDGINLDGLNAGTFSATSGDISGASGISFDLNGGSGAITYPGNIGNGQGSTAEVTGRTGGTVALSGSITESGDADSTQENGGIALTGNTGGSTVISNAAKSFNTGEDHAIVMGTSDGHTLTISGGTLDIDTTSGKGLEAATSGTLNVTGTGNTIDSTTGTALNVSDTDVGATPLIFQRISANGAANGIRLNNTGANSALTVTSSGSGTCTNADTSGCTGGAIGNTTGADTTSTSPTGTAVSLDNTRGITLNRMRLHNNSNYGIRGHNVVGLTIADSVVNGTNGTSSLTDHKDSSMRFTELTGALSITNTDIAGGQFSNIQLINTAGTLNATLTGVNSLAMNQANGGDNALLFEGIETAGVNVTYQNGSVTSARGSMLHYIGGGTGTNSLVLTGNSLINTNPLANQSTGGGGVSAVGGARGDTTMNISNNTIRGAKTNALTVIKQIHLGGSNHSMTATISGNTIGLTGSANSGSSEGDGMELTGGGQGNTTYNVTNNQIRQYNSSGIQFVSGLGVAQSGQVNINVSGNMVKEPGNNPLITLLQGIRVDSGVDLGDTFQTCVKFGANDITGSSDAANKDFRLVASQNTTLRQPGYVGGNTDGAAFANYAASLIGGGAQGTAVANAPGTFTGGASPATCP